ncbi:MAG: DNA polymerase III subunit delta [Ostreibacterium sp.]
MIDSQVFNQQFLHNSKPNFSQNYLFYGRTAFLSEENAQVLIQAAKQHGFTQRDIFYINNRTKFQDIINSMQSPSLFDPKKMIDLRFDTDKPSKKIGEQLVKLTTHQSPNLLIIQASGLNYKTEKEKWFNEIIKNATAVLSKPIYLKQLPNWIAQRAEQLGVKLSSPALQTIMHFSEGNLLWTNQILMQLSHSDYPQPIQSDIIEEMLADMSVFQIDDLTRAILNKNQNALKITQKLAHENESLVLINTVLYREFDMLSRIAQSGKSFAQACKDLQIWQSKQHLYQEAIKHYPAKKLIQTLNDLARLDKINKGQDKGDGWLLLTKIVSNLVIH